VKQETLDWLADHPFYTRRFAFFVGRRCRESTIKAVADDVASGLGHGQGADVQYMKEQLPARRHAGSAVIGIDEVSIGKGHQYASSSAICCGVEHLGSAEPDEPKRISMASLRGSDPANAGEFIWR